MRLHAHHARASREVLLDLGSGVVHIPLKRESRHRLRRSKTLHIWIVVVGQRASPLIHLRGYEYGTDIREGIYVPQSTRQALPT